MAAVIEHSPEGLEYQLRVAAEEIDLMRDEIPLGNLPHVKAFLQRPATRWLLERVQELCWTVGVARRMWRDWRTRRTPDAGPSRLTPCTGAGSARIWLDVTNSFRSGFKGGVARVAMKLAESASRTGLALPVVMKDGAIYSYFDVDTGGPPLCVTADTVFVLVDTFWKPYDEYERTLEAVAARGGRNVVCVHDVIALDYPIFFDILFVNAFRARLGAMLRKADGCITVSNYTLGQVRAHFDGPDIASVPMSSFRLGADFDQRAAAADGLRPAIRNALDHPRTFISVGTLEPRKGYVVTLDAFDRLWAQGVDCQLLVFGQRGWICRALERRITEHPEFGRRLHWVSDASDAELAHAYRTGYCLIQASIVEGFGLPIVEACHVGIPVIASDADIFREVGQNRLVYFRSLDSESLAETIRAALETRPPAQKLDVLTWDDSLRELVATVERLVPPRPA